MNNLSGIGKRDREQLASLLRETQGTISVSQGASILKISSRETSKRLARWCKNGWLSRIKRGFYVPISLTSTSTQVSLEDPWVVAERLYSPCYVGGWSAAEYWGLTEQIFRTILIKTAQKPRNRHPVINGTSFMLVTTQPTLMFGLKPVWREQVKILISDPTRTILDFMIDPNLGGGIRTTIDMFNEYINSEHKNLDLMMKYADQLKNGAAFKRLGFLLESFAPGESAIIEFCQKNLKEGKIKIDPQLVSRRLVTKWRLWVPENWTA